MLTIREERIEEFRAYWLDNPGTGVKYLQQLGDPLAAERARAYAQRVIDDYYARNSPRSPVQQGVA